MDVFSEEDVIDNNGDVVLPSSHQDPDHSYSSLLPLTQDSRSRESLIKVIFSAINFYLYCEYLLGESRSKETGSGGQESDCRAQEESHRAHLVINF